MGRPISLDYDKYTKELMEDLYIKRNLSRKQIGEMFGISADTARQIINHWGLVKTREQSLECQRRNMSEKAKTGWYREATKRSWRDPEIRQKRLKGIKASLTPEYRKKISERQLGRKQPESQKQKMREHWANGKWGFFRSEEYWKDKRKIWSERTKQQFANMTEEEKEKRRMMLSKTFKMEKYQKKRAETMRKNRSWSRSNPEDWFYNRISRIFPTTIRQYWSKEYPFKCDFYIPDVELYIELNLHWTHGHKPFLGSEEDKRQVDFWESKGSDYYENAIYVWTDLDVRKRKMAKDNNLRWVEFFFWEECEHFLAELENRLLI